MKPLHDSTLFTRIGLGVLAHLTRVYGAAPPRPPVAAGGAPVASGKVILVSSARTGEGKSFVAQGLAHALAQQQDGDVVWVDAAFGTRSDIGDNSRRGAAGLSEIMTLGALQGLAPAGAGPDRLWRLGRGVLAQPPLLYRPDAVRKGLFALRAGFGLTVLDAPCLDECGALLAEVDACVFVVDARHTSRHAAQQALAEAHFGPERLAGVVLNHCPRPVPRWLGGD
jgi:Mrp family chromosome partitioning ATPase